MQTKVLNDASPRIHAVVLESGEEGVACLRREYDAESGLALIRTATRV